MYYYGEFGAGLVVDMPNHQKMKWLMLLQGLLGLPLSDVVFRVLVSADCLIVFL